MTRRLKWLAVLMVMAMVAAACGGDGSSEDDSPDSDTPTGQDDGSNSDGGSGDPGSGDADQDPGDSNPDASGGDGPPEIDPGAMPPAGQVIFEVDGQTFTINSADMDYFLCEPDPEFTNVQSESETQDLSVQFDAQAERGGVRVIVAGSDLVYGSFFGPETAGGISVEAPYIVYEGIFDVYHPDDPIDVTVLGMGRVSVTCP